ncbi:GatB/YqeY domain-containing protein [Patescibacteria group bacterium]
MDLLKKIDQDLILALKSKDKIKSSVLRMLKSAITTVQKQGRENLSKDEVIKIISKEIAKRKEAGEMYKKAERIEQAESENQEMQILQTYMPEQLSSEDVKKIINNVISKTNAQGVADIGKVMKEVMSKVGGKADGSEVSQIVRQKLSE